MVFFIGIVFGYHNFALTIQVQIPVNLYTVLSYA